MSARENDAAFLGGIPQVYETHLVPMLFQPYAVDMVQRLAAMPLTRLLEIAAGTGVVTRGLASGLPAHVSIVASDLNQAMIDVAAKFGTARPVEWRQADVMRLPFADNTFDAVVCQFGVMFFPDKPAAYAEVRRVLRPGGAFVFNVWDGLLNNEFALVISSSLERAFPDNPPRFLGRTPYGYNDVDAIKRDLAGGGFTNGVQATTVTKRSHAPSAEIPALAFIHGTPLGTEMQAGGAARLATGIAAASDALTKRFGPGAVDAKMQAQVLTVAK